MYLAEKTGWANGRVLRKRPDLRRGRNCCFPYRHTGRRIVVLKQATVHADLVNMYYNPGVDSLTPPSKRLEPHQTSRRTPSGPARRRTVSQRSPWRIGTLFVRKRAIEALSRTAFFLTNRTSAFTENQLALRRFPEDFRALLIPVAVLEEAAGILKSKFDNKLLFGAGLFVETVCAATQSAALILTVVRGIYSRVEIAAAYLTVIVDAVLLLLEAFIAGVSMKVAPVAGRFTLTTSAVIALVLALSEMPIFVAKMQGRALKQFNSPVAGQLMLSLPLLTGFLALALPIMGVSGAQAGSSTDDACIFGGMVMLLAVFCVSLALGVVILRLGYNLSISFLVISNLYAALLTFVLIYVRSWTYLLALKRSNSEADISASEDRPNGSLKHDIAFKRWSSESDVSGLADPPKNTWKNLLVFKKSPIHEKRFVLRP